MLARNKMACIQLNSKISNVELYPFAENSSSTGENKLDTFGAVLFSFVSSIDHYSLLICDLDDMLVCTIETV